MKYRPFCRAVLIIVLCAAFGCSRSNPAGELKHAMELFATDASHHYRLHENESLNELAVKPINLSFDVIKTDSIVSPYMGTVKYIYHFPHAEKPGEQIPDEEMTATFAYQEKKWVVKSICSKQDFGDINGERTAFKNCDDENKDNPFLNEDHSQWEKMLAR